MNGTRRATFYLAVVAAVVLALLWPPVHDFASPSRAEAESFALLKDCDNPEAAAGVVGPLGVVLTARDGGWVAIRYRDSHGFPGWSSAVGRDGQGQWYVSHEHFCGRFKLYRQLRDQLRDPESQDSREPRQWIAEHAGDLRAAEESPDLAGLRQALLWLGFRPVEAPK